jgi:Zn ribbon nucleic-acid-binding protein
MSGTPTFYCPTCDAFRAIEDWRERGDTLVIALDHCGHVLRRSAGLEWPKRQAA